MDYVKVTTTQNVDIDYDVAGLGDRILAHLLDFAIFMVLYIFAIVIFAMNPATNKELILTIMVVSFLLLYVFYDLICEVFYNGQSVGKRVLNIRVISIDGSQPTLGQYALRWVFRLVDFSLTGHLGALISVAVSPKKQRIGDIVAGTTLIKTKPRTTLGALAFRPAVADDVYEPVFPQVSQLNDSDITLIHDVINNYLKTNNAEVVYKMTDQIKNRLLIQPAGNMNELQFLRTLIKDYNYMTTPNE